MDTQQLEGAHPHRSRGEVRIDTGLNIEIDRASTVVARGLRTAILAGRFDGGFPPEPELARQLGISRHRMREAIRLLEAEGLLSVRSGRNGGISRTQPREEVLARSFVNLLAHRQTPVTDVYEARIQIESSCAALAAERATEADLAELDAVTASWEAADAAGRAETDWNSVFHLAVARAAHNETLLLIMNSLEHLISGMDRRVANADVFGPLQDEGTRAHRAIIRAIKAGDGAQAREFMRRHLEGYWCRPEVQALDPDHMSVLEIL
jgi:DNA-binding FadR family transcriptional regulator